MFQKYSKIKVLGLLGASLSSLAALLSGDLTIAVGIISAALTSANIKVS